MTTKKKLCNIKGLSEAKVEKIKEVTVKLAGVRPYDISMVNYGKCRL
jgi:hypothetical protein